MCTCGPVSIVTELHLVALWVAGALLLGATFILLIIPLYGGVGQRGSSLNLLYNLFIFLQIPALSCIL